MAKVPTETCKQFKLTLNRFAAALVIITFISSLLIPFPVFGAAGILDTDSDGMSDAWETAHGLNPSVNDAALDLDADGLNNLEEFLIDICPGLLSGSNPVVADSNSDSDGDGFSNLQEKNDLRKTDPTNSYSFPNDGNLVVNPGIIWTVESAGALSPAGNWLKRGESATQIVNWGLDPQGIKNGVLKSRQLDPNNSTTFGWSQNILNLEPDTWYEIGVDIASDEHSLLLDPENHILNKTGWGITTLFTFHNVNNPSQFDSNTQISVVENGFQSTGPLLSDWDPDHWVYRSFRVRGVEEWRTLKKYIKTPSNAMAVQISTYNYPPGKGFFDNFIFRKVQGYIDPLNRNPDEIPLKKSGVLQFIQYKGEDFFPIFLHGWPRNSIGYLSMQEARDVGFNSVYYGDSYVGPDGRSWSQDEIIAAFTDPRIDFAVMKNLQTPYRILNSDLWTNDPAHSIPYGVNPTYGLPRMMSDIANWKDFPNLLAFAVGWDEIESVTYPTGTWHSNLRVEETTRDFIHNLDGIGRLIFGNLASGAAARTGLPDDKVDYYFPLADIISNTANLPVAYPSANVVPRLNQIGENLRTFIHKANERSMNKFFMAFGLGNYCWSDWDNTYSPDPENYCSGTTPLPFNLQRFLVFDQIINGAQAVGFFGTSNSILLDDPKIEYHWRQIARLVSELKDLYNVLLEPEFYDEWTVSDPRINAMMKKHGGKIYLLAANAHHENISDVTIVLDSRYTITSVKAINDVTNGNINNTFINGHVENQPIPPRNVPHGAHSFTDDFLGDDASSPAGVATPGYAVHVYEIEYQIPDSDSDGLPDDWETQHFGNLNQGPGDDPDNDQLTNLEEYQNGTDPNNPDTDGDSYSDGEEIAEGFDPNNPASHPSRDVPNMGCVNGSSDPQGLAAENSDGDDEHVLFVDNNNCNCSDSGDRNAALNPNTPWCSPVGFNENRPNHKLNAGDTVYLRGGEYSLVNLYVTINSSGTEDLPIYFKPYPGEIATIRGGRDTYERTLIFNNVHFIKIDGLHFVGNADVANPNGKLYGPRMIEFGNSSDIEFNNVSVVDFKGTDDIAYQSRTPYQSWGHGIHFHTSSNITVKNSYFRCMQFTDPTDITDHPAKYSGDAIVMDYVTNSTVENNVFRDCGHQLLTLRYDTHDVVVQNNDFSNVMHTNIATGVGAHHNTIRNNKLHTYNAIPSESTLRANGIQILGGSDHLIYNNIIYNGALNGNGISIANSQDQNGPGTGFFEANNNKIFHNTVYNTGYANMAIGSNGNFGQASWSNGNQIKNNIFYGYPTFTGEGQTIHGEIRMLGYDIEGQNAYGNVIENNLIKDFNPLEKPIFIQSTIRSGQDQYRRYSIDELDAFSFAENNMEGDPLFVDATTADFHLLPNSPAADSVPCLSVPEDPNFQFDFDGNARQGGSCSAGAFEYTNQTEGCVSGSSDPQGLANGASTVFIDNNNCNCSDSYSRNQALDPNTPWCTPRALRESDYGSKLNTGDTVYMRGGIYLMPMIDPSNRVIITEDNIALRAYPTATPSVNENVTIHASSTASGGCGQLCLGNYVFLFGINDELGHSHNLTIDSIHIKGYIDGSVVDGQTGRLYAPLLVHIEDSNNVRIVNSSFMDVEGTDDLGRGLRDPAGISVAALDVSNHGDLSLGNGLFMDHVQIRCVDDISKIPGPPPDGQYWFTSGFITENVSDVIVQNSSFGDCSANTVEFSTVDVGQTPPLTPGFQQNIIFQNNIVHNRAKNGIQVGGPGSSHNVTIRNNRIFGYNTVDSAGDHGYGLSLSSTLDDIKVYNNLFYDGHMKSYAIYMTESPGHTLTNAKIYNNTFYKAGKQLILMLTQGVNPSDPATYSTITGNKIYNNLFYQVNPYAGSNDGILNSHPLHLWFHNFEGNNGFDNEFQNNAFVPCDALTCGTDILDGTITTRSGNVFHAYTAATFNGINPYVQNNLDVATTEPMFVDAANGDFHLVANSPVINAATCESDPSDPLLSTDFNGTIRSQGGGCTIGAFEYDVAAAPVCGNGIVESEEQCDDGNLASGDGCSPTCAIETAPVMHTIAATSSVGGNISPAGDISVQEGNDSVFTITADTANGYHIADVLVDGVSQGAIPSYTFTSVSENHTIEANFELNRYTLTVETPENGSVAVEPAGSTFAHGTAVTIIATPANDYAFSHWTGNLTGGQNPATLTMDGDKTVGAVFDSIFVSPAAIYTIVASAEPGGHITPNGNVFVPEGEDAIFDIVPDQHYYISDVLVNNASVGAVTKFEFHNVTNNHTIAAKFALKLQEASSDAPENSDADADPPPPDNDPNTTPITIPVIVPIGGSGGGSPENDQPAVPPSGARTTSPKQKMGSAAKPTLQDTLDIPEAIDQTSSQPIRVSNSRLVAPLTLNAPVANLTDKVIQRALNLSPQTEPGPSPLEPLQQFIQKAVQYLIKAGARASSMIF